MRRLILASLFIAAGVISGVAWFQPAAKSKPVEQLLPAESVLYLNWDGMNLHQEAWKKTAAAEAFVDSGFYDAAMKAVKGLLAQAGNEAVAMSELAFKQIIDRGFSVSIALQPSGNGPAVPYAIAALRDGAELEPMLGSLISNELRGDVAVETLSGRTVSSVMIPDTPGIVVSWWTDSGHLLLGFGMNPAAHAIAVADGDAPNITTSKHWKAVQSTNELEVCSNGWLDFEALTAPYKQIPLPIPPDENGDSLTVGGILDTFGLGNLELITAKSGFKGRALWSESEIVAPGEKTGLLVGLEQKTLTWDDVPPLPSSTGAFAVTSFDCSRMFEESLALYKAIFAFAPPGALPPAEQGLDVTRQMLGFDLKTDLFDTLGHKLCAFADDSQNAFFLPGLGVMIELKDSARLKNTVQKISQLIAREAPPEAFSTRRTTKHGREMLVFELGGGFFNLAAAFDQDWLIVGLSPQVVEAELLRLDGKLPSWKPNAEWQAALDAMPKEFISLTAFDVRRGYQGLVGMAPSIMGFAQAAWTQSRQFRGAPGMQSLPISVSDFPPTELVTQGLFPMISVSVPTERGVKWMSRSSAPGLPVPGAGSGAAVPILVALLLPAVQQAREAARRSQSKNNMKQIGIALHNYHDTFGSLPSGTIENEDLEPEKRLSWLVSILPFIEQAALYERIDQEAGWESKDNAQFVKSKIQAYTHPSMDTEVFDYPVTHYVGIAGLGEDAATLKVNDEKAGMFGYDRKTRFRDVRDGLSNTMMVSEALKKRGSWAAGGDPTIRALTKAPYVNGPDGLGSTSVGGMHVLMGDGSVHFMSENVDKGIMEALSTIRGGENFHLP